MEEELDGCRALRAAVHSQSKVVSAAADMAKDTVHIRFADGGVLRLAHEQDCCESVVLLDITGDLKDLVGHPLIVAEERVVSLRDNSSGSVLPLAANMSKAGISLDKLDMLLPSTEEYERTSVTCSFYEFRSHGGHVTLMWRGESNGYYSETVDLSYYPGRQRADVMGFLFGAFSRSQTK